MKAIIIGGLIACMHLGAPSSHAQGLQQEQPNPEILRAERTYQSGVQALRDGQFARAVALFEKSLPHKRSTSDVFFNLVQATRKTEQWDKLVLYAQGFLFREQGTRDAAAISKLATQTYALLADFGRRPVSYRVDVTPAEGEVFVNGVPFAIGAGEVQLMPGRYVLTAELADFDSWRLDLIVAAGSEPGTVTHTFVPKVFRGKVHISTTPEQGVQVFLDDQPLGLTPIADIELDTGRRYLFRFEKDGYDRWVRYVKLTKNEVLDLKPRMEKVPSSRELSDRRDR